MDDFGRPVRFRILGATEVRQGDRLVSIGGTRPRAVLVALLLRPNETLTARQLAAAVWDDRPASAPANLRTHVAALRRVLGDDPRLTTSSGGYRLEVSADEVDAHRFAALHAHGEALLAAGDAEGAARSLQSALSLWQGEPFADLPRTEALNLEATRLTEQRLAAVERHAEARLATGRAAELVAELRTLTAEHPLRERLWVLLMASLYQCGRQADALSSYADVRRVLAAELGIEPGPELDQLRDRILAADPALAPPARPVAVDPDRPADPRRVRPTPPAQLPPAVRDFAGRDREVAALTAALTDSAEGRVFAITGAAGVGKTTLAVHVAHTIRGSYPDGQLYLNLGGAEQQPVDAATALDRLLRAMGVAGDSVPDTLDERAALYRTLLAGRRVLLLLDNAAGEAVVRPLLPGSSASAALVTSRTPLAGLDGAHRLPIAVLTPDEAMHLLRRVVGDARVNAEPAAAQAIIERCGHLPLAVRVGAARLASRPHWRLSSLAARLADEHSRLDELRVGDLDVRASLSLSVRALTPEQRHLFRLLSLLDGPDFPGWIAGPLLGEPPAAAEELVERLVDAGLVEVARAGALPRYRLHDLVRSLARELPAEAVGPDSDAALGALFDAWTGLLEAAAERIAVRVLHLPAGPPCGREWVDLLSAELLHDPVSWFDDEWPVLRGFVQQAAAAGMPERAWRLAAALAPFCDLRSHVTEWDSLHAIALRCARRLAGAARRGEAVLLHQLGVLRGRENRCDEALALFGEARAVFQTLDDVEGVASTWHGTGWMHEWQGRQTEALACHEKAMAGFTACGSEHGMVEVLCSLGAIGRRAGRFAAAEEHLSRAWAMARGSAGRVDELGPLLELGRLHEARGDLATAIGFFERALERALAWNDPDLASVVRLFLAAAHLGRAQTATATPLIDQSLEFVTGQRDDAGQAWCSRLLSHACRLAGDVDAALRHARHAAAITANLDLPIDRARAMAELYHACLAGGLTAEADAARRTAVAGFEASGCAAEALSLLGDRMPATSNAGVVERRPVPATRPPVTR